jgi:hypothetical protein
VIFVNVDAFSVEVVNAVVLILFDDMFVIDVDVPVKKSDDT